MSDATVVGSAAFELRVDKRQAKADIDEFSRDLKDATGRMEKDAAGAGDRIGGSFGRISKGLAVGITALTAAFTAGLAMALQFGQASLKMADTLENSARRIGISTTALQEWQYVARKSGEDANAVSGALDTFANKFEQASAGISKQSLDVFKALGFDQNQLRSFGSVEDALDAVVDRIGELASASDRAAIAEKLGLGPLATALREGSDEVARLRDEAAALGFVLSEEVIAKGAAAQGQLEDLAQVIGVQMAEAFINLSDEVIAFSGHIADAIKKLNEFSGRYAEARQRQLDEGQSGDFFHTVSRMFEPGWTDRLPWVRRRREGYPDAAAAARASSDANLRDPDDPENLYRMSPEEIRRLYRGNRPSGRTELTPVQPRGRQDRSAEREARRAERVEQEILRARERLLGIADEEMQTVQQRFDTAKAQLAIEREAEQKELESRLARKDITAEEYARLESLKKQTEVQEDRVAQDILARDLADERLAQERLIGDLTRDLLSLQSSAARTAGERREIELKLLELAQERARKELLNSDEYRKASPDQQAAAIATQDQVFGQQVSSVIRSNMSPLEAWRDRSLNDAKKIAEAYETVAADGLDALNDGIVDAIMNSKSLGEVFTNVANSIISDLARIAIRQSITEPLANWLFGDGKSSGNSGAGNLLSSIGSFFSGGGRIPGFSSGVTNFSGGLAYVHAGEMLTNLAPGTSVIPAHTVSAMGKGGGPYFDLRGAVMTQDLLEQMNQIGSTSESRANHWSTSNVPGLSQSQTAKQQQYTVGRKKR